MEEERDFVVFTDDDGNDIELDVIDYFDYNGNEYAVLIDSAESAEHEHDDECDCDCNGETSMYIFRVLVNEEEDTEEFVAPADEDMDALIEIVQARFESDCECEDECDGECDCECDCGCHGDK